ncbi:MAG: prepilin-type N-terminal cleavage/methylation domain-containing protein [Fimbriimonadaceae bacterium]
MNRNNRAFTLIELLVVIAIIAILAAILFPVFAQAKLQAKKAASLSNIKQEALATYMYTNDSDDIAPASDEGALNGSLYWFPGDGKLLGWHDPTEVQNWAQEIYPYVKNLELYTCSASPHISNPVYGYLSTPGAGNASYGYNGALSRRNMTSIGNVAKLIAYQGTDGTTRDAYVQPTPWGSQDTWDGAFYGGDFTHAHPLCNGMDINWMGATFNKGDNYGFADGHAKYMLRQAVQFANFGISSNVWHLDVNGNWAELPNTTGMTDPAINPNLWPSWGQCDLSELQ